MKIYRVIFLLMLAMCFAVLGACGSIEGDDLNEEILSAGTASAGTSVYASNCATCHGASLQGATGPALSANAFDANQIKTAVRNGKGTMPPFSQTLLTTQQLSDLVAYIATVTL